MKASLSPWNGRVVSDDVLDIAIAGSTAGPDTAQRGWIIGVAHLVCVPFETSLDEHAVQSVLRVASATVEFPSGPVSFIPAGYEQHPKDDYRLIKLAGASAPHLEMHIGVGIAGFVAVGFTRSDVFDDGSLIPGGVLLTDIESVIADTYTLSVATAVELGYTGDINFVFLIADDRPEVTPQFFTLDEDTGTPIRVPDPAEPFRAVRGQVTFTAETTPQSAHQDIYRMATDVTRQFDTVPQLVGLLDEDDPAYHNDPLEGEGRR